MAFTSLSVQSFELTVTDILDGREPLLDEFAVSGTGLLEFDSSRKMWPRKKGMPPLLGAIRRRAALPGAIRAADLIF